MEARIWTLLPDCWKILTPFSTALFQ